MKENKYYVILNILIIELGIIIGILIGILIK